MENFDSVLLDQLSGVVCTYKEKDEGIERVDIINRGIIKFNIYKFINDFPESDKIIRRNNGIAPYQLEELTDKDKEYLEGLKIYLHEKYKINVPSKSVSERKKFILNEVLFFLDNYEDSIRYLIGSNNKNYDRYNAKVKVY